MVPAGLRFISDRTGVFDAKDKNKMPENKPTFQEVLPKQGQLYQEDIPTTVLCKPKLMPMKSMTLEKLEKMQKDAQDLVKQQDAQAQQEAQMMFASGSESSSSRDADVMTFD